MACPDDCSSDPPGTGFLVGARAGFELPVPVSVELTVGYASLWRSIDRRVDRSFEYAGQDWPVRYDLEDKLRLRGPLVAGGASLRVPLSDPWFLVTRTTVGAWFVQSSDTIQGVAEGERLNIAGAGEPQSSTLPFVMPELSAQWSDEPWSVSAGLSVLFAASAGPSLSHGTMGTSPEGCTAADPGAAVCAPQTDAIQDERAYGPFWILMPQVALSRRF